MSGLTRHVIAYGLRIGGLTKLRPLRQAPWKKLTRLDMNPVRLALMFLTCRRILGAYNVRRARLNLITATG